MTMYEELINKLRIGAKCFPGYELYGYSKEPFRLMPEHLTQAADAIEELQNERDMYSKAMTDEHNRAAKIEWEHRWIPVTERLPRECGHYLVWALAPVEKDKGVPWMTISYFHAYYDNKFLVNGVTHWMPLPEPPKEYSL